MTIEIKIVADRKEQMQEVKRIEQAVMSGKKLKTKQSMIITIDLFPKIFTAERLRILHTLRDQNPTSITELAKILNRPFESVHRDIKDLEFRGLIKLHKEKRAVIPELVGPIYVEAIA